MSFFVFMSVLCYLKRLLNYDGQPKQFKADERKLLKQNRG